MLYVTDSLAKSPRRCHIPSNIVLQVIEHAHGGFGSAQCWLRSDIKHWIKCVTRHKWSCAFIHMFSVKLESTELANAVVWTSGMSRPIWSSVEH